MRQYDLRFVLENGRAFSGDSDNMPSILCDLKMPVKTVLMHQEQLPNVPID
jgi:hypothetical protein